MGGVDTTTWCGHYHVVWQLTSHHVVAVIWFFVAVATCRVVVILRCFMWFLIVFKVHFRLFDHHSSTAHHSTTHHTKPNQTTPHRTTAYHTTLRHNKPHHTTPHSRFLTECSSSAVALTTSPPWPPVCITSSSNTPCRSLSTPTASITRLVGDGDWVGRSVG